MIAVPGLPDLRLLDRDAIEALLIEKHQLMVAQHQGLASRDSQIEHLKAIIAKLRRMMFGAKSERYKGEVEQLELKLEELEEARAEQSVAAVVNGAAALSPARPSRRPLPEHLPREVHTHMPAEEQCPDCGGELRKLGEDVSEILEYIPSSFKVLRHVRPKLSCRTCEHIVQAPAPTRPLDRGLAGPGLLAHVLVAKYADHLPLYRQAEIYAREGVEIERSTLADWVGAASALLKPLTERVKDHVLAAAKIHADDTPVPVLAPGTGKTRTGRLWTYVRDDRPAGQPMPPAVWFAYSPDRKGERPRQHLGLFRGALQADGYAGFHHLYEGGRIQEAACWAHVRRKFYDLHVAHNSPLAAAAIERIAQLYKIEADVRGKPAEHRREVRQLQAKPLLAELHAWMEKTLSAVARKSEIALALRYALARWRALLRYLDDGSIEIDNSAAERALRVVALGRKNYLFAGSDNGGERAAALYTLLGTAKLNGLDPERYLRQVLERIADHSIQKLDALLPWNMPDAAALSTDS